jgi:hypothetical protein
VIASSGFDSWWEHQVCASCDHFRERAGHLVAPADRKWMEDTCADCGGYWLCCEPCFLEFNVGVRSSTCRDRN